MQRSPSESQTPHTLYPGLGPLASDVTIYGVALLLPLTLALVALLRWGRNRWRARTWRASMRDARTLAEGDTVLRGTVDYAAGSAVAVRVEVTQQGTEKYANKQWKHKWKEVARKTLRNVFYIAEPSGMRVRVEPSENVLLVDRMDQTIPIALDRRIRAAQLSAGEQVFAFGGLQRAHDPGAAPPYRDGSTAHVLRAPRKGRMILATEPLHARFERSARKQMIWAVFLCFVVAVFQLFAVPYHVRQFFGVTVPAQVVHKREFVTHGGQRSGATGHNVVTTRIGNRVEEYDLAQNLYDAVAVGDLVWIRRVSWWPSNQQVGRRATVHSALQIVAVILIPLFVVVYLLGAWFNRPWWEKSLDEAGSGHLPEVAPPAR